MAQFEPPPTYADPVLVDETTGKSRFNPIWLKWFVDIAAFFSSVGATGVDHELLTGLQGGTGTPSVHIHMTTAEHNWVAAGLAAGVTGSVTLAALSGGGTQGALAFSNGIITGFTAPT